MELKEITADNWKECVNLWTEEDRFIASNLYSIAEAQFYPKAHSKAVYADNRMVGYVMFGEDDDDEGLFVLDRLMIGRKFRNRGLASKVVQEVIARARLKPGVRRIISSTEPENLGMQKVFLKNGFQTDGVLDDDEIVYYYPL